MFLSTGQADLAIMQQSSWQWLSVRLCLMLYVGLIPVNLDVCSWRRRVSVLRQNTFYWRVLTAFHLHVYLHPFHLPDWAATDRNICTRTSASFAVLMSETSPVLHQMMTLKWKQIGKKAVATQAMKLLNRRCNKNLKLQRRESTPRLHTRVLTLCMLNATYPVWAWERCRLSLSRFLAECHKSWRNQGSFVLCRLLYLAYV